MNSAIITGPTGAIGMALIEELLKNNIEVIAVIRPNSLRTDRIKEGRNLIKIESDLSEISKLPKEIRKRGLKPEVFYHFAWDGTFGNSRNNMYGQNLNIQYALNAVDAAADMGCRCFVGAGSQAEYGRYEGKLSEDTPVFPENGYGIAKLAAGYMTRIQAEQKGIDHIWTRILSIYGPYDGEKTLVSSLISQLLKGKKPSCTKGEQKWDYLYSKDAAYAFRLLGEKGISGKTYCIGSGEAKPLKEYINTIRDEIDPSLEIGFGDIEYAPKQVMHLCADIESLKEDTGFSRRYSFKEGIRQTIDWYNRSN